MRSERLLPVCVIAALTLAGFAWFPGHTWLQSDTQIYTPILDHLADPAVLARDPIAIHAHVTWTIFDDVSLALRRVAGLHWSEILMLQQVLFRALGLTGCFLLALSFRQGIHAALFAAACFGLGAVVDGPSVLTIEYEPVPRGIAVMLLLLALGLGAQQRWRLSMAAAALASLYHPTTAAPFWASMLLVSFTERQVRRPVWIGMAASAGLLALSAWLGPGAREPQPWLGVIDQNLEQVQRLRGAYNWIEQWPVEWLAQHFILFGFVLAARRRLREVLTPLVSRWILTLAVCSIVCVPLQWILLDKLKWILMPQFQPARAVLFITAMAVVLGAVCGWRAAAAGRWLEGAAWMAIVYALPANRLLVTSQWSWGAAAAAGGLALAATGVATLCVRRPGLAAGAAFAGLLALPIAALPRIKEVQNFPALHSAELDQLCAWAAASTPLDSVFLFADVHRRLEPGVFRVKARRALYVDWKGGGQVNIMPRLGLEWWRRWSAVGECKSALRPLSRYHEMGIDFIVVRAGERPSGEPPIFSNAEWEVLPVHP